MPFPYLPLFQLGSTLRGGLHSRGDRATPMRCGRVFKATERRPGRVVRATERLYSLAVRATPFGAEGRQKVAGLYPDCAVRRLVKLSLSTQQ